MYKDYLSLYTTPDSQTLLNDLKTLSLLCPDPYNTTPATITSIFNHCFIQCYCLLPYHSLPNIQFYKSKNASPSRHHSDLFELCLTATFNTITNWIYNLTAYAHIPVADVVNASELTFDYINEKNSPFKEKSSSITLGTVYEATFKGQNNNYTEIKRNFTKAASVYPSLFTCHTNSAKKKGNLVTTYSLKFNSFLLSTCMPKNHFRKMLYIFENSLSCNNIQAYMEEYIALYNEAAENYGIYKSNPNYLVYLQKLNILLSPCLFSFIHELYSAHSNLFFDTESFSDDFIAAISMSNYSPSLSLHYYEDLEEDSDYIANSNFLASYCNAFIPYLARLFFFTYLECELNVKITPETLTDFCIKATDLNTLRNIQFKLLKTLTMPEGKLKFHNHKGSNYFPLSHVQCLDDSLTKFKELYKQLVPEQTKNLSELLAILLFSYPADTFIPNLPDSTTIVATKTLAPPDIDILSSLQTLGNMLPAEAIPPTSKYLIKLLLNGNALYLDRENLHNNSPSIENALKNYQKLL